MLGDRLIRGAKKRRRAENFLKDTTTLSPGDLVVHVEHGIGRYTGLETIKALGVPHDCVALEYAGGDRLYLPVENIEVLSRFGSDAQGVAPIPLSPQGIPNSHLSYAVQWFLLAAVWAGMTGGLIWRITRRPV